MNADDQKLLRLQELFEALFLRNEQTILVRSAGDPLYLPAGGGLLCAEIQFAHGFFSSALHEIAHWLIAGKSRRQVQDYGYWYRPDGRSDEDQREFETFESRNQGLEWILSVAADHPFHVSADNLSGSSNGGAVFAGKVRSQALAFLDAGLSGRTRIMVEALIAEFGGAGQFEAYWNAVRCESILPAH